MRRREDDAAAGGNGDGEWRWWWQDAFLCPCVRAPVHVCARTCARMYVYRDSSLKIQMEYRAFEERSARGVRRSVAAGGGWRSGAGEDVDGPERWGRYFKNRILIRAANPTLCNPYVCVGLTYPLGAASVCALPLSFLQLMRACVILLR